MTDQLPGGALTLSANLFDDAATTGAGRHASRTSVASGALDALPHNGAVITVLAIAKLTHKDSYFDIFVTAVVIPFIALVVIVASTIGAF